ncbi:carboxypeptidase regulatory-like domain-containing protein, partial [archaeon]|nr:carboxypeptidase regulatory-like domain-containing protein [archaeon]
MGLKEAYHGIEDKFFDAMDSLSDKGIPVYSVIDFLEGKGIPAFPATILIVLLVIAGLMLAFMPGLFTPMAQLNVKVSDPAGQPLKGILVQLTLEGQAIEKNTDDQGIASFDKVPLGAEPLIRISQAGFKTVQKSVKVDSASKEQAISLEASLGKTLTKTIQLVTANNEAVDKPVSVSFGCTGDPNYSYDATSVNGMVTVEAPEGCNELIVSSFSQGFKAADAQIVMSLQEAGSQSIQVIAEE